MDIQPYKPSEIISQNQLMTAIKSELANSVDDAFLKAKMLLIIRDSYLIAGIKAPDNAKDLHLMIDAIIKEMRFNKTNIRVDEIEIAFSNGVHKHYGEYFGLNAVSFCQFIKSYVIDAKRLEAIRIAQMPAKQDDYPSDEEIYQISKTNALTAFNEVKLKGTVGRFGVVVYDFLEKIGLLALSQEEKNAFWKKAKQEYAGYLTMAIGNPVDMTEKRKLEADYQSFMEGGKQDKLIVISKRLIVDDKFAKMIFNDEELKDLI